MVIDITQFAVIFCLFFFAPVDPDQTTGLLPVSVCHNSDNMPMGSNPCYQSKAEVAQDAGIDTALTDNFSYASVTPQLNALTTNPSYERVIHNDPQREAMNRNIDQDHGEASALQESIADDSYI